VLELIRHADLGEDVYGRLRHAIFAGTLAPGERLVEHELATRLGVSRAPVRDALIALERDGLVARGRRGRVVSSLSPQAVWEVYSLRSTLEGMAVRLVIANHEPELVHHLESIVSEMRMAGTDRQRLSALDVQFHESLCRASKHKRLLRAWESMSSQIRLLSQEVIDTLYADTAEIAYRHAMLVRVIEAGDPELAERAAREHIDSVSDRVTRVLLEAPEHYLGQGSRVAAPATVSGADGRRGLIPEGNAQSPISPRVGSGMARMEGPEEEPDA
jgi:DNA-binding GntR family transcriptional regulator